MTLKMVDSDQTPDDEALRNAVAEEVGLELEEWLERVRVDFITAKGRVDFGSRGNHEHHNKAAARR